MRLIAIPLAFVAAILLFLWYIGVFGGNVRTVYPGRVYRSAQLTGRNLDDVLRQNHIQTVINLRGGSASDAWYRSEIASCREFGADHVDVDMSARLLPAPARMNKLLDAFDHARYPVLFHCASGSDRSGLVGTLYLDIYQHEPLNRAESDQLTWRYGHFAFGQTHAMNDFLNLYRATGRGVSLREWIVKRYPSIYATLPGGEKQIVAPDQPARSLTASAVPPHKASASKPGAPAVHS